MRNLKRALSLTLASVMLLGMMVVGSSAAAGYDDVAETDNVEARSRTGTDDHHAQEHNGSQSEAEGPLQVSHSDFLL